MTLPAHEAMVENIIAMYMKATPEQRHDGGAWYHHAERIIRRLSDVTGTDPHRFAHALAALSPRNPWKWNVQDAYAFASAANAGDPMPGSATTFKRNQANAWAALTNGGDPWKSAAMKVRAFVEACTGNTTAIVVDVWAYRVATMDFDRKGSPNKGQYKAIVAAYMEAAWTLGIPPSHLQAITWLVLRTDAGIARPYKKGTAEIVIATMEDLA